MVVLMGWIPFLIETSLISTRMSVAITTMLTIIAYRFALGRLVPSLSYLTRFDYFTLGSTVLVFVTAMAVAVGAYFISRDKLSTSQRIDRWGRVAYPVVFAIMMLLIWWI
jgi:hypothetical protein